ncbi:hypothetical protein [Marivita hallyeonensis]|uniref:Uncharacterized protein n=1 Tax=Marivita hallyeonensis TaxID=996342 RepID=A0A1M5URM0_9RHOB|nr:hypothetical protein [Marivita hallyeonensis]SHH65566.1 hypothetical protein SAMN05443551_2767 [Marivita hallyeonensis]
MRVIWGLILSLLMVQQAAALSCLAPNIARDYANAAASEDTYIVVKGQLFFDEAELPNRVDQRNARNGDSVDIPGWLAGQSLTADGFSRAFERDVILRVSCLGPWCGGTAKGDHLAFLKQEDQQWVMELSPCPGMTYQNPTEDQLSQVQSCFVGEACEAENP